MAVLFCAQLGAQQAPLRFDEGRITVVAYPRDATLARALLSRAVSSDSFPGLPRPKGRVLIAIAPDAERFRQWVGPRAPEWGAAVAFPAEHRIVMQGSAAPSSAGDPVQVLRHELAHLALHEAMGNLPPRWFDEGYAGYAAGEWGREEILATSVALLIRGLPSLDSLDGWFHEGSQRAGAAYALAYRAVSDLAALDTARGLSVFFQRWRETRSMDRAVRDAFGLTLAGFENRWQSRTQRRYGALAVLADLSLALGALGILIFPLYFARRRRDRRRMAALVAQDQAAELAAQRSALEELLRSVRDEQPPREGRDE